MAVTAASEQFQLVADRVLADHVTGGVPLVLDRAVHAGDGEVVILDADRGLGLDGQIAVKIHTQAAGHSAGRGGIAFKVGIAQRTVSTSVRTRLSKSRSGDCRNGDCGEKNVTHCFYNS
ncbi:hypothetical protein D3C72_1663870 [compost metagenome]